MRERDQQPVGLLTKRGTAGFVTYPHVGKYTHTTTANAMFASMFLAASDHPINYYGGECLMIYLGDFSLPLSAALCHSLPLSATLCHSLPLSANHLSPLDKDATVY